MCIWSNKIIFLNAEYLKFCGTVCIYSDLPLHQVGWILAQQLKAFVEIAEIVETCPDYELLVLNCYDRNDFFPPWYLTVSDSTFTRVQVCVDL